ncbi:ATP-binding protein [Kribbella sp. CA-294648]|uniref:ATP-binding protein n=1 Tax=Kribbella sp. CA-294648 TaxID=3239948 RepID=UPI003D947040
MEREGPLAVLTDAAKAGRSAVVLVAGEAGMGKTSVVDLFARQVADRSAVFVGACDDLLVPPALGPIREALRDVAGPVKRVR